MTEDLSNSREYFLDSKPDEAFSPSASQALGQSGDASCSNSFAQSYTQNAGRNSGRNSGQSSDECAGQSSDECAGQSSDECAGQSKSAGQSKNVGPSKNADPSKSADLCYKQNTGHNFEKNSLEGDKEGDKDKAHNQRKAPESCDAPSLSVPKKDSSEKLNFLTQALFESKALNFAPEDEPFWYTSGKFGPYYLNTHFLAGGKEKSQEILDLIERGSAEIMAEIEGEVSRKHPEFQSFADYFASFDLPVEAFEAYAKVAELPSSLKFEKELSGALRRLYEQDSGYATIVDLLCERAEALIQSYRPCFISGGERRDFFFSIPLAESLKLPHLTIFKNSLLIPWKLSSEGLDFEKACEPGAEKHLLHVADLITEASSFFRAWIPFSQSVGFKMCASLSVIDRGQGGSEKLKDAGVDSNYLMLADEKFFELAREKGLITEKQKLQACEFGRDPDAYMRNFLRSHPGFLASEETRGEKIAGRVKLCRALGFEDLLGKE